MDPLFNDKDMIKILGAQLYNQYIESESSQLLIEETNKRLAFAWIKYFDQDFPNRNKRAVFNKVCHILNCFYGYDLFVEYEPPLTSIQSLVKARTS
jgi:hypothetical protein